MAYPLPRLGGLPKTPKQMDDGPQETKARASDTVSVYKRYLSYIVVAVLLLLCLRSLISTSKQKDRVPFTHDPTEKYLLHKLCCSPWWSY